MKKVTIVFAVVWFALIGWFSSQPLKDSTIQTYHVIEKLNLATETELVQSSDSNIKQLKYLTRKGAHFFLFFVMGCVLATGFYRAEKALSRQLMYKAWGFGTLFGVLDELHQYFVPGRSMQLKDMVIDSFGVIAGVLAVCWMVTLLSENAFEAVEQRSEEMPLA